MNQPPNNLNDFALNQLGETDANGNFFMVGDYFNDSIRMPR